MVSAISAYYCALFADIEQKLPFLFAGIKQKKMPGD